MMKTKTVILALAVVAMMLPALAEIDENTPRLVVTGEGKESANPDMVTIVLGVETKNISASTAAAQNADLMARTIQALKEVGVKEQDLQTTDYSISTTGGCDDYYQECEDALPREFVVTNQLRVEMDLPDADVGQVIDAAVDAGTNAVRGISFGLRDPKPLQEAAMKEAVTDAMKDAEIISQAARIKLGRILTITEGYTSAPTADFLSYARSSTPIIPGQVEATTSVIVEYEIIE